MIKKMKRNLTGVLLTALMMGACNHAPQEGTYHLRGKLEGRTIYLQDAVKNAAVGTLRYDSTTVSEGRFMFNGKVTAPQVRELFIQETDSDRFPVTLPVVLEPGEINAKIGDIVLVEGTGLNEEMMQTLMALDEFRGRDFTGKEINEIKEAFGGFVLEQIVKHAGSPVGNYLYEAYQNKLNEKQQAEARKTLGIG